MTKTVSVKVKRKDSAVKGKRTALFLQVIYDRIMKRAVLEMEVSENEWQEETVREGSPRTGEACPIRPRTSVKFKPGKYLLQRLNKR